MAVNSRGRNWSVSESLWRGFTAIDLATGAYVAVATGAVLLSFRGDGIPGWPWILTAHTLIAALVLLAPRARSTGPLGRFLGDWYPMLLLPALWRTWHLSCLSFLFFPDAGPRYACGLAHSPAPDVGPARFAAWLLDRGDSWGAAFPSSHVAASEQPRGEARRPDVGGGI